jgi:uncharacterized protein DUF6982
VKSAPAPADNSPCGGIGRREERMPDFNRVVVHLTSGRMLKGTTRDFFPNRPLFHLVPHPSGPILEVRCRLVKALFFVREFGGNPDRKSLPGFVAAPGETAQGKKLAVRFKDGELLCGYSLSYAPDREGFFMFPADAASNNLRIYVVTSSTAEIACGPAAETLARRMTDAA